MICVSRTSHSSRPLARLLYCKEILHPPGHPCQLPYSGTRQNGHHVSVAYAYMYMSMHVNTVVQKVDICCKFRCACFEGRYEIQHEVRMQVKLVTLFAGNNYMCT
jgi:hypothetical protein